MAKLGYLGLGIMGRGMALNLVKAGHDVMVWNRSSEKCDEFVAVGASKGSTPAEVVASCDITFACVSDPQASRALVFEPGGVLEGVAGGKGYVDMSTIDSQTAQDIGKAVVAHGGRYLEAPVSGSKKPAEDGTLIMLAAGDRGLFDEASEALSVMGKMSVYLGEVGQGARMKLVVNMIMGTMMTAFTEGMTLAQKAGLSTSELLSVLDAGAMSNPMFRGKGPLMEQETFAAAFPLKHAQKDMRLALLLGDELGHGMPTVAASNEVFKKARQKGLGDNDFSSVFLASKGE